MQREEALHHFIEEEVKPRSIEKLHRLESDVQANVDQHVQQFIEHFQEICRQLHVPSQMKEKKRIAYITLSLLRTELLEGSHLYVVEGTDAYWFLDRTPMIAPYDAGWVYRYLEELTTELLERSKAYMGQIRIPDIEQIKLQEAIKFHQYLISIARRALPQAVKTKEYANLLKEAAVEIRIGEYFDVSEVVYKEDYREKEAMEVRKWLEQDLEEAYAYEAMMGLDLSRGSYENLDLRYTNFHQSDLSNSTLSETALVGANLSSCQLSGCDFRGSWIYEADFSDSELVGANFQGVYGTKGLADSTSWDRPGFLPVRFDRANLERVNFEGANLEGASFIDANLEGANFKGANLKGAIFSQQTKERLEFDESQKVQMVWK